MNHPTFRLAPLCLLLSFAAHAALAKPVDTTSKETAASGTVEETDAADDATQVANDDDEASPQEVWEELVERVPDIKQYTYYASTRVRHDVPAASELPTLRMLCTTVKTTGLIRKRMCFPPLEQMDATERSRVKALLWASGMRRCDENAKVRNRRCLPPAY